MKMANLLMLARVKNLMKSKLVKMVNGHLLQKNHYQMANMKYL